ncbi:uncharacterized protein LOC133402528 isoform X2 [Phycodurus eques]|uniref:uncharacterized protein LOC133402528 isoform X2 n=1 Tax=Phycodurus eques TaxID=693459 RepID=UPI002ACF0884|nr:uncharacterized protein LOC133402528 isoform X2 [Phycodurus eques]
MESCSPNPLAHFTDNSYKMSEDDVRRLIEFRASNELLFTGKRNSAKMAWSTILRALDLQGKLTAEQIAKKWDNLRSKYKDLKQPYQSAGQEQLEGVAESWPWFRMMDDAMHGRLYNSHMVLGAPNDNNDDILEFLIKTELEDSGAAADGAAAPAEGPPVGWRRTGECSYKMSEAETERLIKVRAANEAIFTGRKHSAKLAWRAVLHELGLQGKLSTEQLAKKWDNLKRRYKELKFPPHGAESNPSSWPWFYLMNDAAEGRLAGAAPALAPVADEDDEDDDCEMLTPAPRKRARRSRAGMADFLTESEMDLLVRAEGKNASSAPGDLRRMSEFSYKLTEDDIRKLVELRAANEALFTGRRNSAKPAWRGIVEEMGLTGKITPDQVAKKWDNLKTKFKDLKFPPRGVEPQGGAASWPWFRLMNDALEGRLAGNAARAAPMWIGEEDAVVSGWPPSVDGRGAEPGICGAEPGAFGAEPEVCGAGDGRGAADLCESEGNVTYIDASGEECSAPTELSYKMSEQDTRRLITLRAANEVLFTGKRNAAKAAWKAIIRQLDLQGKVSTYQVAKKWDNLKRRFKDLKYPPAGMENTTESAASWPWFRLMNDAMEGRLVCGPHLLTPVALEPAPGRRPPSPPASDSGLESPAGGGEPNRFELERERQMLERERAAVRAERTRLERERVALEADRALLEQEKAALGRERDLLHRAGVAVAADPHSGRNGAVS